MASLEHARSCNVHLPLRIRINKLIGKPKPLTLSSEIEKPDLSLPMSSGDVVSDMHVTVQIFSGGIPMAMASQTSYKSFQKMSSPMWDEWLELPIKYSTLPRNARAVFTVRDIASAKKSKVIGSVALPLFNECGTVQEGGKTLKLIESNEDVVKDLSNPRKLKSKREKVTEVIRLDMLEQTRVTNELAICPWLDATSHRAVERTRNDEIKTSSSIYLKIELPHFENRIVYCEIGNDVNFQHKGGYTVLDPEILYADNLVENKHKLLTRSKARGSNDQDLKPNPATRDVLDNLTQRPPSESFTPQEKDLIWRFRFYLSKNKKALTKFLRCIDWNDKVEVKQAIEILQKWEKIDVSDALELLGKSFSAPEVREYAVARLDSAKDDELLLYLLQLVQALKFEPLTPNESHVIEEHQPEVDIPDGADGTSDRAQLKLNPNSLAGFLVRRASTNVHLGSYFYWYILVECKDPNKSVKSMYTDIWNEFVRRLEYGNAAQQGLKQMLKRQRDFLAGLRNVSEELKLFTGSRPKKIEKLKSIFRDTSQFRSFEPLALPLDPAAVVVGINPDEAYVFKSALNPLKISFITPNQTPYSIIYKNGDDLRQDQLCLNIITLIDRLLKNENLDLKLTPYAAMATSTEIGMLQFVASEPVAGILGKQGSIQKYLREHNRAEEAPYSISKDAMDTYVKSCAGYCVITYLLGVGDRHFDNLLLTKDGHMFHIDFGYILGRDPKPYPPPMKLTKEMVEGMGGANSEEMKKFRSHCYSSFLIVRKHANLILNLFALMVDSSVHDIALDPDKTVMKIQEKFRLDLNDEMAVKHMQELIDESVSAMFAQFVEKLHTWAQYWRK